jgi:hypothetical protein
LPVLDLPADPHPAFGGLAGQDVGAAVDGLATEFADFAFGLDDFFALEMAFEDESVCQLASAVRRGGRTNKG